MSGGSLRISRRSFGGVSPVRTATRSLRLQTGERPAQVPLDVVVERLQRRDVEHAQALPRRRAQPVERVEERGQRLARAGRRLDQHVRAARDRRPALRPAPASARRRCARTRPASPRRRLRAGPSRQVTPGLLAQVIRGEGDRHDHHEDHEDDDRDAAEDDCGRARALAHFGLVLEALDLLDDAVTVAVLVRALGQTFWVPPCRIPSPLTGRLPTVAA